MANYNVTLKINDQIEQSYTVDATDNVDSEKKAVVQAMQDPNVLPGVLISSVEVLSNELQAPSFQFQLSVDGAAATVVQASGADQVAASRQAIIDFANSTTGAFTKLVLATV